MPEGSRDTVRTKRRCVRDAGRGSVGATSTRSERNRPCLSTDISAPVVTEPVRRPTRLRRTGLVATGFLTCALPVVFTISSTWELVTGEPAEHRFHQLTGQGLLLCALWLGGLVPLLRAGWSGRRPSSAAGLLHLTFMATGRRHRCGRPRRRRARPRRAGRRLRRAAVARPTGPAAAAPAGPGRPGPDAARAGHRGRRDAVRPGPDRPPERRDGSPRAEPALLRHGLDGHHPGGGRDPRRGGAGGPSPRRWWPERVWRGPGRWACCSPPTGPGRSPCWCSACR